MGKVRLKDRLQSLGLIAAGDLSDEFEGDAKGGGVESFFRGGGCQGLGSRLFKGRFKNGGKEVVLKQLFVGGEEVEEKGPVEMELHILKNLSHANLVAYETAFMTDHIDDGVWLVMGYCGGGSIAEALRLRNSPFNESQLRGVLAGVLSAAAYLHSHNFIHRDIRGENILLTEQGVPVLGDLGTVGTAHQASAQVGTSHWMAPEITSASDQPYTEKVDMWSIGITVIEMAEMETPVTRDGGNETATQMHSPKFAIPSKWSPALNALVACCLEMEPAKRPSAQQLLESAFMKTKSNPKAETLLEVVKAVKEIHRKEAEAAANRRSKWFDEDDDSTECNTELGNSLNSPHQLGRDMSIHFDPVVSPPPAISEATPAPLLYPEMNEEEALRQRNEELQKKIARLRNVLQYDLLLKKEAVFHSKGVNPPTSKAVLGKMREEKALLEERSGAIKKSLVNMKKSISTLGSSISAISSRLSAAPAPSPVSAAVRSSTYHTSPVRRMNTSIVRTKSASPSPSAVTRSLTQTHPQAQYVPGSLRKNAVTRRVQPKKKSRPRTPTNT